MRSANYTIQHLDLSQEVTSISGTEGPGHYLVFWYRSVPLGEVFIDSNRGVLQADVVRHAISAVTPALKHHLRSIRGAFNQPDSLESLRNCCERAVSSLEPEYIAETCNLSVVICTRNRPDLLKNCLKGFQRQFCKPGEIVVVDNASTTEETRKVCSDFPNVRYVREDRPGLDIARNTGARHAKYPIVAYTDDDTVADPGWVYRIHETFANPDVVAMTGLVLAGSLATEAEVIFERYWPFNRGYLPRLFDQKFFNEKLADGPPVWEIGAGANMAFRKDIFEDIGYFDERLDVGRAGCSGDSELWYRILANGFSIVYNPLAIVHHYHRSSLAGLRKQLHAYMKGFTVAILIQYNRFGHRGNLKHLLRVIPAYYMSLIRKGFPNYAHQHQTIFSEMTGIFAGFWYYFRHRNTQPGISGHDTYI